MGANLTIFNVVAIFIFGYAVFEKGFSGWWFLAYLGFSLLHYSYLKSEMNQKDREVWKKQLSGKA